MRTATIFIVGMVAGALLAILLVPQRQAANPPNTSLTVNSSTTKTLPPLSSIEKPTAEKNNILLGNIMTVPFQELYGLLSTLSPEEMAKLAQQLSNLPQSSETNAKISTFFKAWAHLDPKSAIAAVGFLKTADARSIAIDAVLEAADASAAPLLAASINDLPPESLSPIKKTNLLAKALSKWSQTDPAAAAKFIDASRMDNKSSMGAHYQVAKNWAVSDPEAALAWVQQQADPRNLKVAMSGVIAGWWEKDPRAAEDYVASNIDKLAPETAMMMAMRLLNDDPQRAKDWANQLTNVEARRSADSSIATQLSTKNPRDASDWAASLSPDVRETAMRGALDIWVRKDAQAAAQWINGLEGAVRDEAVGVYSSTIAAKDPATALAWAATVADARIRDRSINRIWDTWVNRNPNDAAAWLQGSTLPEAEKSRLLALLPKR